MAGFALPRTQEVTPIEESIEIGLSLRMAGLRLITEVGPHLSRPLDPTTHGRQLRVVRQTR
jgi:hypothetical protein